MPVFAETASGSTITDVDGNRFIDLASGIAVTGVGNCAPEVVAAVQEEVAKLTHTNFATTPYANYVEVCKKLDEHTPGDFAKKSVLVNSGAEAVENAIKIARKYTGRSAIVVMENAFHGRTNLTMAMTTKSMPYSRASVRSPRTSSAYRSPIRCATTSVRTVRPPRRPPPPRSSCWSVPPTWPP